MAKYVSFTESSLLIIISIVVIDNWNTINNDKKIINVVSVL